MRKELQQLHYYVYGYGLPAARSEPARGFLKGAWEFCKESKLQVRAIRRHTYAGGGPPA